MLSLLLGRQKKRLDDNPTLSTLDYWSARASRMTQAGTLVDEATSLTYSAVFCATRLLTESCAFIPMKLLKRNAKGTPSDAVDMPQYRLTSCQPNPEMPIDVWKIGRTMHQINGGNGFAEIEREKFGDPESPPVALWPIEASRVRPVNRYDTDSRGQALSDDFKYVVRNNDGTSISLKSWEMLHYPGCLSDDGVWGKSIVAHARQDIGTGIAMVRHAGTTFSSGKAPPAVVYGAAMRDPEDRDAFRREWKQIHGSADSGEIALLPLDARYEKIGINNNEGQFIEAQGFNTHAIARFWRVPVHHLMEMMAGAGYNSLVQITEEFVRFSLMTWLMLQEGQCNQKLLTPEERLDGYYFAHDLSFLLRADPETRAKIREINLRCGHWTLNDSFREDGLPTGGPECDEHYIPLEMTTAKRIYDGLPPPAKTTAADPAAPKTQALPAGKPKAMKAMPTDQKLLAIPDLRQSGDFDCGACATLCVASYFGVAGGTTEEEMIAELGTTESDGTTPDAIIDWLIEAGLVVTSGMGMTIDDLLAFFRKGQPVIVPMQLWGLTPDYDAEEQANEAGHYTVINGVGMGQVFYHDPVDGQCMLPEAEFVQRWHDMEADGEVNTCYGIAVAADFGATEEQDEGEQEQKPVEKAKPKRLPEGQQPAQEEGSGQASAAGLALPDHRAPALAAAREVLKTAISRLLFKEGKAALALLSGAVNEEVWLATFKAKHFTLAQQCLEAPLALLASLGIKRDCAAEAAHLRDESYREVMASYNGESKPEYKARMESWPTERAERETARIMGEI